MSENTKSDDRLVKASEGESRQNRESADEDRTQQDGTMMTVEERRRLLRSDWLQEVLPTPPKKPGWHYCWLSTTNGSDPIYKRLQKGYELVRNTEVPGFGQFKVEQGEFEGLVACNEMILAKIPEELYQDLMSYFHYELPVEEEQMLKDNAIDKLKESDRSGRELGEIEGFDTLARRVRLPTFQ
jgi:hypothetical protein